MRELIGIWPNRDRRACVVCGPPRTPGALLENHIDGGEGEVGMAMELENVEKAVALFEIAALCDGSKHQRTVQIPICKACCGVFIGAILHAVGDCDARSDEPVGPRRAS